MLQTLIGMLAAMTAALGPVGTVPDVDWDYQIGGSFDPAAAVDIVARDRADDPLSGAYNVCYVNAFQTQPNERRFWRGDPSRWRLVLKRDGRAVVDGAWGEWLLDTRSAAKPRALADIVDRWMTRCARDGFDGVELDNLDSWGSRRLISRADNRAFAKILTRRGQAAGLAVAQKNWAELATAGPALGFDFAVAEECGRYRECGAYAAAYGDRVLVAEYRRKDFRRACTRWGDRLSIVLRDRAVSVDGDNRRC